MILEARDLSVAYGSREVLHRVEVIARSAELLAIVGPNGAGKTTLLRAFSAAVVPSAGSVRLDERSLASFTRRELAQHVAVVPQDVPSAPGFSVRDVVAMGRAPHQGAWLRERAEDSVAIDEALERCRLREYIDRPFDALSGGERKRVLIAQALAQRTPVLLLDEPSAFLDIGHAVTTFELAREQLTRGCIVVAVVHDFGLAARFADRVVLLREGRVAASGPSAEILDEQHLTEAFGVAIRRLADGSTLAFAPGHR